MPDGAALIIYPLFAGVPQDAVFRQRLLVRMREAVETFGMAPGSTVPLGHYCDNHPELFFLNLFRGGRRATLPAAGPGRRGRLRLVYPGP